MSLFVDFLFFRRSSSPFRLFYCYCVFSLASDCCMYNTIHTYIHSLCSSVACFVCRQLLAATQINNISCVDCSNANALSLTHSLSVSLSLTLTPFPSHLLCVCLKWKRGEDPLNNYQLISLVYRFVAFKTILNNINNFSKIFLELFEEIFSK